MTYGIIERGAYGRKSVQHIAATYDDAVKLAHDTYKMIDFEEDADHPGCADFLTVGGIVLSIEPVEV